MKIKSKKYYIIFFIIGILILLITSVLIVTNWIISEHVEKQIESKINQTQLYIETYIKQIIENKVNICKTIVKNKNLISSIENKDSLALDSIIQKIYNFEDTDYFLITDSKSNVLIRLNLTNGAKDYAYLFPGIFDFINKISKTKQNFMISYLTNKEKYYLVCTVPVIMDDYIVGTLSTGYNLSSIWNLDNYTSSDFTFLDRETVLYSTLTNQHYLIEQFIDIHIPVFDAVLATSQSSEMINTTLGEKDIYSKIIPFGYGLPVYILISVPKAEEYVFLNTLLEYIIYIFIFFSSLFLITFFVIIKRNTKEIDKKKEDYKENITPESEVTEGVSGMILISNIISTENELNISLEDVYSSYQQIQSELIELYEGKVENIKNNQMIASFAGYDDSIDKSVQCSQAIMKLINKEAEVTNYQIAIGLNYGSIYYGSEDKPAIFGKTLEMTESILQVSKPGQILIQENQASMTKLNLQKAESKLWKFKNLEDEVRLVDLMSLLKKRN